MFNIPNFQIDQPLYNSENSSVYRAIRSFDKQFVILKCLKADYPSVTQLARYQHEYELLSHLTLPGIIQVYGLEKWQEHLILVLEDFGGESLTHWLKQRALTVTECLSLAIQIADSLGQVHAANVIHKDINPANFVWNPSTGTLKLIDFGIATRLPRETLALQNPNQLEGTLPYLSPEQTGRMNRALDYRTDLYSLGVTFYELFTGRLPFDTQDAMELVHCHLAKQPIPPHQINTDIPPVISHLILRLMAKAAEERYQSAWGVKADLVSILEHSEALGNLHHVTFDLGQHDFSDRFHLPQQLYGREEELQQLLVAFEKVSTGQSQLLLVAGYSGIGKTALVQEIYKPITEKRGYFIAGKFDQFQRNVPYSAVVQAFRDLMRQLLAETQSQLDQWKTQLLTALGNNGQVIIDVISEVELIIGRPPAVPSLPPTESQNRFNLVFQNFIKVFCQPSHPLVIFLDDLQWIDSASLKLITLMMSDIPYLLLIGAYRDNEVSPTHPLMTTVEEMQQQGLLVSTLTLTPLALPHLNQLVSDTLHLPLAQTLPLAELVLEKTGGNPFFVGEFLKTLYVEQLLSFNSSQREWQWDLAQIKARNITDNVVELMTGKILRLKPLVQSVLTLAAAISNQFDLDTLSIVSQQSIVWVKTQLWEALVEGLVVPVGEKYKFVHDRVQQAAYSLIPEGERAVLHWQIGQLLLKEPASLQERLFEVVDHLNQGRSLATTPDDTIQLARLNLQAGQKARQSAAYHATMNYLQTAVALLPADSWATDFLLTLTVHEELTEASYLNGDYAQTEKWAEVVLQRVPTILQQVRVYEAKMLAKTAENKLLEAIAIGLQAVAKLGVTLPPAPTPQDIQEALENTAAAIPNQNIPALIELPPMTDAYALAALNLLSRLIPPSFIANPPLFVLTVLSQAQLSIKYGNAPVSAHSYACYGIVLSSVGEIASAYQCGQLALQVVTKFHATHFKSKMFYVIGEFILYLRQHLKETTAFLVESYQSGLETGDFEHAGYALFGKCQHAYLIGQELNSLEQEVTNHLEILHRLKQKVPSNWVQALHLIIYRLLDKEKNTHESGSEVALLASLQQANDKSGLSQFHFYRLTLFCVLGEYQTALKHVEQAKQFLGVAKCYIIGPLFYFYHSLCLLAVSEKVPSEALWQEVIENQQKLALLTSHAPMNFQHKYDLVEAEQARVLGQFEVAAKGYEKAITGARDNNYLQEEALAYELAAKFYLSQGMEKFAHTYLTEAYQRYQRWGALAKLKHLERQYPQWLPPQQVTAAPVTATLAATRSTTRFHTTRLAGRTDWLDLTSVMKAAQALSGEIMLENLLTKMMQTVLENAGAQRGVLILAQEKQWLIQAEATVQPETVTVLQALPLVERVPTTLLNYVIRTKQSLVFAELQKEVKYQADDYVRTHSLKSVLCLTLLHQQQLVGVIYLENNLTAGTFTPDRFQVLTLLSSQMAISLDNARFVRELQQARQVAEEARHQAELAQQAEAQARQAAEVANQAKTAFLANVSHELRTPLNGILGCAQVLQRDSRLTYEQQESLNLIYHSGEHLLTLVNDILDISKLQTAQIELQLTDVHLEKLLKDLCQWYRNLVQEKRLTFHYQPSPHLPIGIIADAKRLRQILLQLLSNAVKFTQQGSITFQIQSESLEKQPGWHHFQFIITDTGIGMMPDHLAKLFTPFEQASDWRHKTAGAGLGLAMAKQLVELMGGKIQVHSQPGQGSTFTVQVNFAESTEWQLVSTSDKMLERSDIPLPPVSETPAESTTPLKGPSAAKAAELCELSLMGDFLGILELVDQLEQEDEELRPFVAKVRQWAKEFRDEPIEALARQFMEIA